MPETPMSDELQREIHTLRRQLAESQAETHEARQTVYALLNQLFPYTPPSEEELRDMLHGERGKPFIELIEEYERSLEG